MADQAFDELVLRLEMANTKTEIALALGAIEDFKGRAPLHPLIVEYASDSRWLVRQSAISALGSCPGEPTELLLLRIGEATEDEFDLGNVIVSLGRVGGDASLSFLESLTTHRKEDVAMGAIDVLASLGSPAHLPCFLAALEDRRWGVKWSAMIAIEAHGDASAVIPVLDRVKRILGRKRSGLQAGRSELCAGLQFLWAQRTGNVAVGSFFATYLPKRRHRLTADEAQSLDKMIAGG